MYNRYKIYVTGKICYYIIKCKVKWLCIFFNENKIIKLFIEKISLFKYEFRWNTNLNN